MTFNIATWKALLEKDTSHSPSVSIEQQAAPPKKPKEIKTAIPSRETKTPPEKTTLPTPGDQGDLIRHTLNYEKIRVYAGSYFEQEPALKPVKKLRQLGLPSFCLVSTNSKGKTLYNVVAGLFDTSDEAKAAAEKLKKLGYSTFISDSPKK